MTADLLTMALQVAACAVLSVLAGVVFVWAICYWADVMRGR